MSVNVFTAVVALVMLGLVARAYIPLLTLQFSRWVTWVLMGLVVLIVSTALRSIYWDVGQFLAGDAWQDLRAALGGQAFSAVFNVGTIVGCWLLLHGRLRLIPLPERHNWRWWDAWMHPCERCSFWRKGRGENSPE